MNCIKSRTDIDLYQNSGPPESAPTLGVKKNEQDNQPPTNKDDDDENQDENEGDERQKVENATP